MLRILKDSKDVLRSFLQKFGQGGSMEGTASVNLKKLRSTIFSIFKNL